MPRPRASLPLMPLCLLAACTQAPASAPPAATPSPPASASPLAQSPAPTGGATATPTPGPVRIFAGEVRDLADEPLANVMVAVRSLDAGAPFSAETRTDAAGRWRLAEAPPPGSMVEVVARGEGLTERRRVVTAGAGETRLGFGGSGADAAFFLSDRPEITRTEPLPDGEAAATGGFRYKLTLSRPLAAESQARFLTALRLMPANDAAAQGAGSTDLTSRPRRHPEALVAAGLAPYALKVGDRLARRSSLRLRAVWEADGRTLTLSFGGALQAGSRRARYQVALVGDGRPLVDTAGQVLGTGASGQLDSTAAAGEVILGAFVAPDPALDAVTGLPAGSPAARWAGTHDAAVGFYVPVDDQPPRLAGVELEEVEGDTRLRLSFDEPLLAYDGSEEGLRGSGTGATGADLAGLTFVLGDRGSLRTTELQGGREDEARLLDPRTTLTFGASGERDVAFRFDPAAFVAEGASAPAGAVRLAIDPEEPSVLALTLVGRKRFFDREAEALAVRCEGVGDPAGNRRKAALADATLVTTTL